jgi:hypothetical protein
MRQCTAACAGAVVGQSTNSHGIDIGMHLSLCVTTHVWCLALHGTQACSLQSLLLLPEAVCICRAWLCSAAQQLGSRCTVDQW